MSDTAEKKAFLHDPQLDMDGYPEACPFNTRRAGQTHAKVRAMGLLNGTDRFEAIPEPLTTEDLALFHTPEYLDALDRAVRNATPQQRMTQLRGLLCSTERSRERGSKDQS